MIFLLGWILIRSRRSVSGRGCQRSRLEPVPQRNRTRVALEGARGRPHPRIAQPTDRYLAVAQDSLDFALSRLPLNAETS